MNLEDKKTSFVNPRFGVKGINGLIGLPKLILVTFLALENKRLIKHV
jgi:hypothetical protein